MCSNSPLISKRFLLNNSTRILLNTSSSIEQNPLTPPDFFFAKSLADFLTFAIFAACITDTLVSVSNRKMHFFLSKIPKNEILLHINVQNISKIRKIGFETIFH